MILSLAQAVLLAVPVAQAQVAQNDPLDSDLETRVNPRTGNVEQVFNPWRTERIEAERTERDAQLRQQQNADDAARNAAQRENLRKLSQDIYLANVDTLNRRHRRGLARMQAGQASTTFTPDKAFSVTAYLIKRYPTARELVNTLAQPASMRFHEELRRRALSEQDLADGEALAFVAAFEAYSGQKTQSPHLDFARRFLRNQMLTSSIAQGADDLERQKDFEYFGTLAFVARALTVEDLAQAKEIAGAVLQALARNPAFAIELTANGFAHKGELKIAAGKATTLLQVDNRGLTPQVYAKRFSGQYVSRATFENQARESIQTFYAELSKRGGQRADLSSIAAFLLAANAAAITGQELAPAQLQSARAFARNAILKSRDIQAAPDAEKQLAAELMMISTVAAYRERNALVGRANLQQIFQALGEDPANYELTAEGLVRR